MARFTSTAPLNIRWLGNDINGAAGATHRIPDALYDEFNAAYSGVIPGLTWVLQDEVSAVAGFDPATKYDKTGGTISGAVTITGALVAQAGTSVKTLNGSVIFADQYSSIQAAHDALPATGGTIVVPAGTYLTSGSSAILTITASNFRLVGAGRGATIFAFASSAATYLVNGNIANLEDVTIEGIEFDGRNLHSNVADVTAIRFANTGTKRITVRDCYIHNMPGTNETFGINFGNVVGGVIDGVYVSNCRGSGIGISGSTAIAIANCVAEGCGWMGYTVSSNTASDSMSRDITITNCIARNNVLYGFNLESTERSALTGLVSIGNGRYGFAFAASGVAGIPYSRYIAGAGLIAVDNSSSGAGLYDGILFAGNGTTGASGIGLAGVIAYDARTAKLQRYGAVSSSGTSNNVVSGDLRGNLTAEIDLVSGTRNEYRPVRTIISQVTLSAAISLTNASTSFVPWNTETLDDDGLHSIASNTSRITATIGGRYRVRANPRFAANGTGDRISQIYKNGVTVLVEDSGAATSAANNLSRYLEWVGDLVAGDYVELATYQNSGGALNLQSTSWFALERV